MADFISYAEQGHRQKRPFKSKDELYLLAEKHVDMLRGEGLPIWQAKEALRFAIELMDWEKLKER